MTLSDSVVLLGAGASARAGVPMSLPMTRKIREGITGRQQYAREAAALNFVCGTLIADKAARGSTSQELDVEEVFAAVQLLAERRDLEVTPFVSTWHPAVDALDQPEDVAGSAFDRDLSAALIGHPVMGTTGSAYALIRRLIDARTGMQATGATYRHLADLMLAELRDQVATTRKDVDYLRPLVSAGAGPTGLTIATLNYDRSIEIAAQAVGVPVSTGIDEWIASGKLALPRHGIRLLKLHGSIDWVWHHETGEPGQVPRRVVTTTDPDNQPPALIFGQRAKLRAEGPFLSLLAEFEDQLSRARQLVAIGYSFRDDHVNEIVRRWIAEGTERALLVIDPNWPHAFPPASFDTDYRAELDYWLTPDHWPAPAFAPRLEIWRKTCEDALPELVAEHDATPSA